MRTQSWLQCQHYSRHYLRLDGQHDHAALPDDMHIVRGGVDALGGEAREFVFGGIRNPQLCGTDAGGEQAFDQCRGHVARTDKANPEVC